MTMELFGVGKAALYGFLASPVNLLALLGVAMAVDTVLMILPDVAGNCFCEVGRLGAPWLKWADSTLGWV